MSSHENRLLFLSLADKAIRDEFGLTEPKVETNTNKNAYLGKHLDTMIISFKHLLDQITTGVNK